MHEIEDVGFQPRLAGIHLWRETGKHRHSGVESQICQDTGDHVNKADGNPRPLLAGAPASSIILVTTIQM